jgi:signal transduction histidine kinase
MQGSVGTDPGCPAPELDSRDRTLERMTNELISTVSHELRTPLASVRGFVELLLVREYPREEQRKFLIIIDAEIKRLTRLINDFLDVQRIELGETKYELAEHDLCELLRECVELAAGNAGNHRFQLELPERPLRVRVDSDRIHQVVMNLLSNAVKFSPQGGTVYVRACEHNERAAASVRDEGMGMPPDVVQKLFRKFYRADSSLSREIEGTGLGLALVREIITGHGGEISVESQPGVGSEFFFNLPLLAAQNKPPRQSPA